MDTEDPAWVSVDQYVEEQLIPPDEVLETTLRSSIDAGLPQIHVSPALGKMLHLLALTSGARKILEIGTLAGYSTICLARALPADGRLVSLEVDPKHAELARQNIARAKLDHLVEVRLGRALETLPQLAAEQQGPFDFVFIDADKVSCPDYFAWALKLSRVGTIIITDNVVRKGALPNAQTTDASVQGVRRLHELVASEPRVTATTIQTVGRKGYDGYMFAVVRQ